MTRTRWIGVGAVLAVGALVAFVVTVLGGHTASRAVTAAPVSSILPGIEGGPAGSPLGSPPASTAAGSPAPANPGASGGPAPFVQNFAGQPGVRPQTPLPSPTAPYQVAPNIDGCDHGYGTIMQCVPWTFPAGVTDGCAWLRAHGFGELKVTGKDRLGLDTNHNGTACDPSDG